MKKFTSIDPGKRILIFISLIFITGFQQGFSQGISFELSGLNFKDKGPIVSGSSLEFGPDGRLYAMQLNGEVKIYSIFKPDRNIYEVTSVETLFGVKSIPNHDDNGQAAFDNRNSRQSTGLTVGGTASNPVIYVSSSDPKWGGPSGDKGLDTNSGIITRLTWNGTDWDVVDLVRGLPRSEENHSTNAVRLTTIQGKPFLLVASGGLTNAGSPSKNFTYISEYALSAAVLSIDLEAIDALPTILDPTSGRAYKYDLPTLDDPTRANVNGIYNPNVAGYNGIDVNDPFGGNDGLNMAMLVVGGPVQIFSGGYRNAYDLVVTEDNKVFVTDNGANVNWGGLPQNEGNANLVNNRFLVNEPGGNETVPSPSGEYVDNQDHLLMVTGDIDSYTFGGFYAGHPTPLRANPGMAYQKGAPFPFNPGGAGLYTKFVGDDGGWVNITPPYPPNDFFRTQILIPVAPGQPGFEAYASNSLPANWPPVPASLSNSAEADFRSPTHFNPNGAQPEIVTVFKNNSNGITEYTASNFDGAMKGALVVGRNEGFLHLLKLNPDGTKKTLETDKWNLNGGNALGVTSNGDNEVFPGTIWVATLDNRIMVLTPVDDLFCIEPGQPGYDPLADYDNDGYTNQDEIENGTDPCSGASVPNDYDQDSISDLNDLDDDGDGIRDSQDPFQLGNPIDLPVDNELFSNQLDGEGRQSGYLGLGLTGLMNNGAPNPNWLNWLDVRDEGPAPNDIFGGTAGAIQVAMTGGTANGTANNQEKGFQFGVNVGIETGVYTISSGLLSLASPSQLYDFEGNGEIGIQIGDGTQSNFIKLILTKTNIIAAFENNNVPDASPLSKPISISERPLSTELVRLSFKVTPAEGTVEALYKIGERPEVSLGIIRPTGILLEAITQKEVPLAIGIFGSSFEPGKEFLGTWDYFRVSGDQPFILRTLSDIEKIMDDPDLEIDLQEYFGLSNGNGNLQYSIVKNTDPRIGASLNGSLFTLNFPNDALVSQITLRATNDQGLYVEQQFTVRVIEAEEILLRINAGGNTITSTDGERDWLSNSISGPYTGNRYSVNLGTSIPGATFPIEKRHSSIPAYIDGQTYQKIFASERYNSNPSNMVFDIPLPDGVYTVNLYLGNSFSGTADPGKRVFDIVLEGKLVLENLDPSAKFGHLGGGMESFKVSVTDGVLNIAFQKEIESPLINGIEIIGRPIQTPIQITNPLPDQTNRVEDAINSSLVIIATGGDGNLTFSATGLPKGVSLEPTNGTIYGSIDQDAIANTPHLVTITVDDSDNITSDAVSFNFTWTILPQLLEEAWTDKDENEEYTARHENSFVQAGNKFYLMGGRENSKTIDIYDYMSNRWTSLPNSAPLDFNHFQATEFQGLIWIIGSFQTNSYPDEVPAEYIWVFDPANEKWIQGPQIPEGRRRGSAGLILYQNKFYVIGGNTKGHNGGYVSYFDEFDPITGQWKVLPNAPRARDHFHATVIGNKLYAASGRLTGGSGGIFAPVIPQVDVYNFATNTWSTLPAAQNIPTPRAGAVAANFEGKLLIAGGEIPNSTAALTVTEIYDPVLEMWNKGSNLNFPRHGTQAIVSGNGVFVTAGSPVSGGGRQKNMEVFGVDNPKGETIIASSLESPSQVLFEGGETSTITLRAKDGNQGIYVRSIEIIGGDAGDFILTSVGKANQLINANSSKEVEIQYVGKKIESNAVLKVAYGNSSTKEIQLKGQGLTPEFATYLNTGSLTGVLFELKDFVGEQGVPTYFNASNRYTNTTASEEPLYQTERNAFNLTYAIPVPNGTYTVKTYHNELWFGKSGPAAKAGNRVFDINLEGRLVKDNFDIYLESNNLPIGLTFADITVTDGMLNLNMVSSKDRASISGIAVISTESGGTFNSPPVALATSSVSSGLAPLTVQFTGSGSTDDNGVVAYLWDFKTGSTSTLANPSHTFSTAGSYNVSLKVTDAEGLSSSTNITITVSQSGGGTVNTPPAAVATSSVTSGPAPLTVNFTGSESTDNAGIIAHLWDFKDGSTSSQVNPSHTFTSIGTYNVSLTVMDAEGMSNSTNLTITVTASGGVPGMELYLNGGSTTNASYEGKNFVADQNFPTYFNASNRYTNTAASPEPLYQTERNAFTLNYSIPVPNGTYTVKTYHNELWFGKSGPSAQAGRRVFDIRMEGTLVKDDFDIFLVSNNLPTVLTFAGITVTDGVLNLDMVASKDRASISGIAVISNDTGGTVNAAPVAVASSSVSSGLAPLAVNFTGSGSTDDKGVVAYLWDFKNGVTSTQANPSHTFTVAGSYNVSLKVTDAGGLSSSTNVLITVTQSGGGTVNAAPVAVASSSVSSGKAPLAVNFTGSGSTDDKGVVAYLWDFKNGATSTQANPSHTFTVAGTYNVSLKVSDAAGLSNTTNLVITVTASGGEPGMELYLNGGSTTNASYEGKNFVADQNFPTYFNASNRYTNTAASTEPLFQTERNAFTLNYAIPVPNGTYTVKTYHNELWFGKSGPVATAGRRVFDINMEGTLVKDNFDIFLESNNLPTVLTFAAITVTDGVLNLDMVASKDRASISGIAVISNETGGTVNAAPVAVASSSVSSGLAPLAVNFTGSGSTDDKGVVAYMWDFKNGATSTQANPSHTFTAAGIYSVSLRVTDAEGLNNMANVTISVSASGGEPGMELYLNGGSISNATFEGNNFLADQNFPSYFNASNRFTNTAASTVPLFQTERNAFNLNYAIPVPNGTYTVKTYHNELWFGKSGPAATAGKRVFDISLEGELVKDNFDIYLESNNLPVVFTFAGITVTDGVLNLDMIASKDRASISGIAILGESNPAVSTAQARLATPDSLQTLEAQEEEETVYRDLVITLYPNPAKSGTVLAISQEIDLQYIVIHNMAGQMVHQFDPEAVKNRDGNYYLPLDNLTQGVYLVSIFNEKDLVKQLRLIINP